VVVAFGDVVIGVSITAVIGAVIRRRRSEPE